MDHNSRGSADSESDANWFDKPLSFLVLYVSPSGLMKLPGGAPLLILAATLLFVGDLCAQTEVRISTPRRSPGEPNVAYYPRALVLMACLIDPVCP